MGVGIRVLDHEGVRTGVLWCDSCRRIARVLNGIESGHDVEPGIVIWKLFEVADPEVSVRDPRPSHIQQRSSSVQAADPSALLCSQLERQPAAATRVQQRQS